MQKILILLISLFFINSGYSQQKNSFKGKTIHFNADDGVKITADLYMTSGTTAPFIILFHQAGFSRGAYRDIAPKLNALGFNCMAIDQRSGKEANGVINETHLAAKKMHKPTEYVDAIPDLEAAFQYVRLGIKPNKLIIWGSSYSAAITFFLGSSHYDGIDAILSFSPGEYFKINGKEIKNYAARVKCPVFISSAKNEQKNWQGIYDAVKTEKHYFLPTDSGKHGSKALWNNNNSHAAYWDAVTKFLLKIKG